MSHSLHLSPLLSLTGLFLIACPEPGETTGSTAGGEPTTAADPNANGGAGPAPHSNPNDARFSVTPGQGVKIQGTFQYDGEAKGSYRIDFQKQEGNAPPTLVHAIELDKPGPFSVEVPKEYGAIHLTGFVDLKGDGPSGDDPIGRTPEPLLVGTTDITDVVLSVALGNSLGIPPQPGQGPSAGDPSANGQPGGDPSAPQPPPPPQPPPLDDGGASTPPPADG